jgi:hypothetical protein
VLFSEVEPDDTPAVNGFFPRAVGTSNMRVIIPNVPKRSVGGVRISGAAASNKEARLIF